LEFLQVVKLNMESNSNSPKLELKIFNIILTDGNYYSC